MRLLPTVVFRAAAGFLAWYRAEPRGVFSKALVQEYRAHLEAKNLAPSSLNIRLAAIRKLALEAADNGLLAPEIAAGIARVRGVRRHGVRAGNWLTREQAQALLDAPVLPPGRDSATGPYSGC